METSSEEVKGNVKEAKAKFFQSLEESSSSMSTKGEKASRIGTSILPVGKNIHRAEILELDLLFGYQNLLLQSSVEFLKLINMELCKHLPKIFA